MPEKLHRGPRFVPAKPLPSSPGSRILMPELLGRVCWLVRRGIGATQQQIADEVHLPAATISKLEMGIVTIAVHHLDSLALAYTVLDREVRGDDTPAWDGWQLHQIAGVICERLGDRGVAVVWLRPDLIENEELYLRDKRLLAAMKECWPDEIRRRP